MSQEKIAACQFYWHEIRGGEKSEGGAGIHFPHTPFSSRPARAQFRSVRPRVARHSIGF